MKIKVEGIELINIYEAKSSELGDWYNQECEGGKDKSQVTSGHLAIVM